MKSLCESLGSNNSWKYSQMNVQYGVAQHSTPRNNNGQSVYTIFSILLNVIIWRVGDDQNPLYEVFIYVHFSTRSLKPSLKPFISVLNAEHLNNRNPIKLKRLSHKLSQPFRKAVQKFLQALQIPPWNFLYVELLTVLYIFTIFRVRNRHP